MIRKEDIIDAEEYFSQKINGYDFIFDLMDIDKYSECVDNFNKLCGIHVNEDIEKRLFKEHLICESTNNINEAHGYIDGVNEYIEVIINIIDGYCKSLDDFTRERSYNFTIENKLFNDVSVKLPLPVKVNVKLFCNPLFTVNGNFNSNNDCEIEINLYIKCLNINNKIKQKIYRIIGHEITHGMESYYRNFKNGGKESHTMISHIANTGYPNIVNGMKDDNEDEYHRKLCRFLYYTDKLEKNAIIGELKQTMDWYRESGYIKSMDDLFKCYQMTQAYMTMKYLEELKTDLIEESEKFDFNQTIITLTKYASILNLKGKYPTTLNQLHKIIESRFNQFKSQYNKQIYKILYDVFLESEIDMQKT